MKPKPPHSSHLLQEKLAYAGNAAKGEIELLSAPSDVERVQNERDKVVNKSGISGDAKKLGLVFEDEYILIFRDPVKFPSGKLGTHIRIIERAALQGSAGTVILPILNDKVVLRSVFRHTTRSWELEIPRGFRTADLSLEEDARKEIAEEVGLPIRTIVYLGPLIPSSGLLSGEAEVFVAELEGGEARPTPELNEAFGDFLFVTVEELDQLIRERKIRDGYTLSALQMARANGFL